MRHTMITSFVSAMSGVLVRGLTLLCVAVALIAIVSYFSQTWQLLLFGLGVYSVFTYLIRWIR